MKPTLEIRFAPKTGIKRPWEIWAVWPDHRGTVFWASYATQEAAEKKAAIYLKRY